MAKSYASKPKLSRKKLKRAAEAKVVERRIERRTNKEPMPTPSAEKITCFFCRTPMKEEDKCHGCDEYVCEKCSTDNPWGKHTPEDHRASAESLDPFEGMEDDEY